MNLYGSRRDDGEEDSKEGGEEGRKEGPGEEGGQKGDEGLLLQVSGGGRAASPCGSGKETEHGDMAARAWPWFPVVSSGAS
jgi:hypothetical protein